MKHLIYLLIILLSLVSTLSAQNENDRAFIAGASDTTALRKLIERSSSHYIRSLKRSAGQQSYSINSQKRKGYLSGFNSDGTPVYDIDDNSDAAVTIRVDNIWRGGESGLNLDGTGINIGHWEAEGLALPAHQELVGRITHVETKPVSGHSTHTACTMIGTGVESQARGMASGATIVSCKSDNDESEIASFAAAGGILTNHSYSTGDPEGNIPLYGAYTTNSREWDEILYYAPFLTTCKSAGNNRNDGVNAQDNGYDLIYTVAGSKNVLTIGAVNDVAAYRGPLSVAQSSFGNWGPTDDWRIKPDIVANGVSVYSADNASTTAYKVRNGTSMATPSVTGAVALLQQHYHELNSVYMKSATVKALLIGTADEAGNSDGPDFQNGWGLLNARRAAEVISDNGKKSRISEVSISNGSTYTTSIEARGASPLVLTLAWTDPPGTPGKGVTDDQTPVLVNDIDVKITGNGLNFEPWKMSPNATSDNFSSAATKGNNSRDNVERIDVSSMPGGVYTVTVTHKNELTNGRQDFSMVVHGLIEKPSSSFMVKKRNTPIIIYPEFSQHGSFSIVIPDDYGSGNYEVRIFDLLGKVRMAGTFREKRIHLDSSNLAGCLCVVEIVTGQEVYKQYVVTGK